MDEVKRKKQFGRNGLKAVLLMVVCLSVAVPVWAQTLRVELQDFREPGPRAVIEDILIPKFEALHPGVKVEVSFTELDELY